MIWQCMCVLKYKNQFEYFVWHFASYFLTKNEFEVFFLFLIHRLLEKRWYQSIIHSTFLININGKSSFALCSDTQFILYIYLLQRRNLIFDFSECVNGKYGLSCENNCNHCQQDTQCHNVNGSCLQGCSPGYIGPFCNISKWLYIIHFYE